MPHLHPPSLDQHITASDAEEEVFFRMYRREIEQPAMKWYSFYRKNQLLFFPQLLDIAEDYKVF